MAIDTHVTRNFGYPWFGDGGPWDLLEVKAESEEELSAYIARTKSNFWKCWIVDTTGRMTAALYKPNGARAAWECDLNGNLHYI